MARVNITVDPDVFTTEELVDELSHRHNQRTANKSDYIDGIITSFRRRGDLLSLVDSMKAMHLRKVLDKYTLEQIEAALPE